MQKSEVYEIVHKILKKVHKLFMFTKSSQREQKLHKSVYELWSSTLLTIQMTQFTPGKLSSSQSRSTPHCQTPRVCTEEVDNSINLTAINRSQGAWQIEVVI